MCVWQNILLAWRRRLAPPDPQKCLALPQAQAQRRSTLARQMQTHQELPRRPDPLARNVPQLRHERMPVLRGDNSRPGLAREDPELEVASGRPPHILATALPQRGESQREIRAPPAQNIERLPRRP